MKNLLMAIIAGTILMTSCNQQKTTQKKLNVVTTTNILTDLVHHIGGDSIQLQGLMGAGVDPHLYKASEGDFRKLNQADVIFYGGLHLEGKLVEIFEKLEKQKTTVGLGNKIPEEELIVSENFGGSHDPHLWFDVDIVKQFVKEITNTLVAEDPKNETYFKNNEKQYLQELDLLNNQVKQKIEELPKEKRILVTAHDAFNYFGKKYGFEVVGLQGISTVAEAGVQDVQNLTNFIIDNNIKAIFVESSVPRRTIEALQAAVNAKGHEVEIGGSLYSDALGNPDTPEGTYTGMFTYNVNTIVDALK